MSRDLGDEASKLFNTVFPTLLDRVSGKLNGSNKATSKILDSYQTTCVFECLSFLIKYEYFSSIHLLYKFKSLIFFN